MPIQEDHVGSTTSLPQPPPHFTRKTSHHSRKNTETDPGPLGLNIIYTPEKSHKVDIVFIHGLGGSSRKTWSKNEDPELFWPSKFLPLEPDVCLTRILTFGYNANFRAAGNVSTSVLDFAKDLLFDLKYAKDDRKEDLNIGNVSETKALEPKTTLIWTRGASDFCGPQYGRAYNQGGKYAY